MQFLQKLASSLLGLGVKRLVLLGVIGALVFSLILFSVYTFQKPVRSILYSGLDKADVSAIGAALSEVGMAFDVNEAGDAVLVDFGQTAQARMLLAERGLPKSDKSGYDLFDQMGSLGLTSFMQQVTKVRALEGELVRSIQQLDGIKSARVHLALKSEGALRNRESKPTASVVIRVEGSPREGLASTIRHLVAAAIPGLQPDQVMVSTTEGQLLAGPRASEDSSVGELLDLESRVSAEISKRIANTLEPFAGPENLRVSVSTTINLDKRQINETKFDPNSKVERSMYTLKSVDSSKDGGSAPTVSVDQNIPQEVKPAESAGFTDKKKEDKQETVNFEVDTKQTAITSAGYVIERMSVAVVVNKKAVANGLPAGGDEKLLTARLAEIESIVKSAAGVLDARGDTIKVSAIDFYADAAPPAELEEPGFGYYLTGHLGTIINAVSLIIAMLVVLVLGLRPALKILMADAPNQTSMESLPGMSADAALAAPMDGMMTAPMTANFDNAFSNPVEPELETASKADASKEQLNKLVNVDVDRAAQVLKKWLNEPERNAA